MFDSQIGSAVVESGKADANRAAAAALWDSGGAIVDVDCPVALALGFATRHIGSRYTRVWYAVAVIEGVMHATQELGHDIMIFNGHKSADYPTSVPMFKRRCEGLLHFCFDFDPKAQDAIQDAGIPLVILGGPGPSGRPVASVDIDNAQAEREATAHLISLGHRRLAILVGDPSVTSAQRLRGFRQAHDDAGLSLDEANVIQASYTTESGAEQAKIFLSRRPEERPTGVVCYNDTVALGVIQAACAMGISVPGELSVIGCDDIVEARIAKPALTTIRQPLREIGEKGVELLADIIIGAKPPDYVMHLPHELIVRASTAPPGHAWVKADFGKSR